MATLTGGCLCGAVRYVADGEVLFSGHCHCRDCQRATGAGHASFIGIGASAVKITGETGGYAVIGDSGLPSVRRFCVVCGSQVFGEGDATPGVLAIYAGTLDDTAQFVPQIAIYTRSRAPWDKPSEALPEFDGAPPLDAL